MKVLFLKLFLIIAVQYITRIVLHSTYFYQMLSEKLQCKRAEMEFSDLCNIH